MHLRLVFLAIVIAEEAAWSAMGVVRVDNGAARRRLIGIPQIGGAAIRMRQMVPRPARRTTWSHDVGVMISDRACPSGTAVWRTTISRSIRPVAAAGRGIVRDLLPVELLMKFLRRHRVETLGVGSRVMVVGHSLHRRTDSASGALPPCHGGHAGTSNVNNGHQCGRKGHGVSLHHPPRQIHSGCRLSVRPISGDEFRAGFTILPTGIACDRSHIGHRGRQNPYNPPETCERQCRTPFTAGVEGE